MSIVLTCSYSYYLRYTHMHTGMLMRFEGHAASDAVKQLKHNKNYVAVRGAFKKSVAFDIRATATQPKRLIFFYIISSLGMHIHQMSCKL